MKKVYFDKSIIKMGKFTFERKFMIQIIISFFLSYEIES